MGLSASRRRTALAICIALVVGFCVTVRVQRGASFAVLSFDDIGQAAAAALGAGACYWRAVRSAGRWRLSWALIGSGLAAWSIGQFIWSYYELISSDEIPFPSLADAGFLLFPVFCLAGLFARPSAVFVGRARARALLDGVMVAGSLFIISWATTLGIVYHAGAQSRFAFAVSLAYPASDVVMVTIAVIVASRAKLNGGLALLVGGLASMAVADSAFTYLVAKGTYVTGAFTDVAWVAAFLAIGLSALFPSSAETEGTLQVEGSVAIALPYVVLSAGTVATLIGLIRELDTTVIFAVESVVVAALLLRQLLVVVDNRRLTLDVVAQKDELTYRAFHDPLTGLANRALFYDRVGHAIELHRRDLVSISVIYVDLDDFKSINDAFGHDAGDAVLVAVADRLRSVVRTSDTVARLGGDEFAILLEDDADATLLARRLLDGLRDPFVVGDRRLPVRASIGSTTLEPWRGAVDIDDLLKQADIAMYSAKRAGKGAAVNFTPVLATVAGGKDDLEMRIALNDDVQAGRIGTVFQPIVHTVSGELYAYEALARWSYNGRRVPPIEFIPLADRGGFLADLDLVVARRALEMATAGEFRPGGMIVSTNIGLTRILENDLPGRLDALMREFCVPPDQLVVEVSEQDALEDPQIVAALEQLREIGVTLAVDDFGVGYSNLSRLETLRPGIVKLDRSFIAPLDDARASRTVIQSAIQLAHDLGAIVVGEGVETQRQRDALAELECDTIQGFLIGVPTVRGPSVEVA